MAGFLLSLLLTSSFCCASILKFKGELKEKVLDRVLGQKEGGDLTSNPGGADQLVEERFKMQVFTNTDTNTNTNHLVKESVGAKEKPMAPHDSVHQNHHCVRYLSSDCYSVF